jgi:diguanylate cyclase (GGDEF)-like protein/PAS domain S-box-containing protein
MSQSHHLLLELARRPSDNQAQFGELVRDAARGTAELFDAARVRVWLLREHGSELYLAADHPVTQAPPHGAIAPGDHPDYLDALEAALVLTADDAQRDLRLRELAGAGLIAAEARSTLHAPMRLGGALVGALWIDRHQPARGWTDAEQGAAVAVAQTLVLAFDHVHRRRAEEILAYARERAQVTLDSIGDGVITTDVFGRIDYINPFAIRLTGWPLAEAHGRSLAEVLTLLDPSSRERIDDIFQRCLDGKMPPTLPVEALVLPRPSEVEFDIDISAEFAVEAVGSAIRDRHNEVIGAILVLHDVTELRGMTRQLSWQASHDALTGLINRREFEIQLKRALLLAREEGHPHVLMYLDLDQFKVVNDTCGHLAGDEMLKQVTMLLQKSIRRNDTLARLGGDEFGLLLHGCDLGHAERVADTILRGMQDFRFGWQGRSFDVGVSIGIMAITPDCRDMAELLSNADAACYVAKDQGRNRAHVYRLDDEIVALRHGEMQWVHRINRALAEHRLRLFYQPLAALDGAHATDSYCELLVRMIDETGQLTPPMAFIPAAERYQLMTTIDRWVLQSVLAALGRGGSCLDGFSICAVNLSGQSLCNENFLDFVLEQLAEHGVDPARLCFEITETSAIANLQRATDFIDRLSHMGCRFALDDFGSGLSSFAYLKDLNVEFLKIDGAFVRDLEVDPIDGAMVAAINQIGHVMGKKTIAEAVENDATLARLRAMGVDYAQGYGVARPLPLDIDFQAEPLAGAGGEPVTRSAAPRSA